MKSMIVLENGECFEGESIGAKGERMGEVILQTSVVGYQEMITDPTNAGKIIIMTYPLIGNYGVAKKFNESDRCQIASLVIKESSRIYSNWQAEGSFDDFIKKEGLVTLSDVDTRTAAINIRDSGEMLGIVSTTGSKYEDLLKKLKSYKKSENNSFIEKISVKKPFKAVSSMRGPKIGVIDLGMLRSFTRQLAALDCDVTLLPYNTSHQEISSMKFDGLIVSNGPEDDRSTKSLTQTVSSLIGKIPLMGISAGHEIICMALGGRLKKMKIGHHGANYPVIGNDSFKGYITVQNHSYVIDEDSIKKIKGLTVTLRNVNDNTVEAVESRSLKIYSIQYNPVSPGFNEVNEAFIKFIKLTKPGKQKNYEKNYSEVKYAKA